MDDIISSIKTNWPKNPGATVEQLEELNKNLSHKLPQDFETFLLWSDGGEGYIGKNYLSLWDSSNIIRLNALYKISFYLPHLVGIGTDGGDDCYAFDYSTGVASPVFVRVPLGDLDATSYVIIGENFAQGLMNLLSS